MFDIGFTEIVVIAVVALIVIGPERLPKTARTLGHLFGRLQRYVNDVKSDISREMELEELRKLQQEMKSAASDLESSMTAAARDVETGMRGVEAQLNAGASETPAPAPVQAAEFAAPASAPSPAASAEAPPSEPARQPSLPGFDKI
ncbi:MAG: twin-arginine translocase subunit TatB [Burkholderiales bacterium]|jgi:sec-independent protein translocase protein TatB|nr:twin-arginine translocase subunit TatB [Burkholderiales bacterium]